MYAPLVEAFMECSSRTYDVCGKTNEPAKMKKTCEKYFRDCHGQENPNSSSDNAIQNAAADDLGTQNTDLGEPQNTGENTEDNGENTKDNGEVTNGDAETNGEVTQDNGENSGNNGEDSGNNGEDSGNNGENTGNNGTSVGDKITKAATDAKDAAGKSSNVKESRMGFGGWLFIVIVILIFCIGIPTYIKWKSKEWEEVEKYAKKKEWELADYIHSTLEVQSGSSDPQIEYMTEDSQ